MYLISYALLVTDGLSVLVHLVVQNCRIWQILTTGLSQGLICTKWNINKVWKQQTQTVLEAD